MWQAIIITGILISAIQAIRVARLLYSAIWLALTSALTALLLYLLGASEIAVIELSVGAGLVTVLFVFAINITGEESPLHLPVVPKPLAWLAIGVAVLLLGWLSIPPLVMAGLYPASPSTPLFAAALWKDRALDVILQVVFIFAGVLGVLGLLDESKNHPVKGEN
jgi:uncharacterized MnhB-related membrane protein